jgi:hypothetical protein
MILLIVYLFIFIGLILIYLNKDIYNLYIVLLLFFLFKFITNYRKCTLSYIECKLRNVKKEEGYLHSFLERIVDLRYTDHIYIIIFNCIIILYYHYYIKGNKMLI